MAAITHPLGHKIKSAPALSAPQVLAQAEALGVVLALSDGELRARGNQAGIAELAQHIRACKPELVKLLALPPPDPELLALADRYCTAIQASDKARADWRSDVQATPPGDREELAAYLRAELAKLAPVAPAMPSTAAPTAPAKPVPKFSIEAPWRAADRTWLTHWQQCPQCQTAGRTNTTRCAHGQDLFTNYQQATDIEAGK